MSKPWVVQKFGGTSVGKFPVQIAEQIVKSYSESYRVAVVCSARSSDTKAEGTTTRLMAAADMALSKSDFRVLIQAIRDDHLAAADQNVRDSAIRTMLQKDINKECDKLERLLSAAQIIDEVSTRTQDTVISAGEKLSCMYMAAVLNDRGLPSQYVDLSAIIPYSNPNEQVGVDASFYKQVTQQIVVEIAKCRDKTPVITGYFGLVPGGLITNVGRGYTDLCAALTAVGLDADELQVWKEVDGIFTADPRKVPTARLLSTITPEEASELTYYGSEVIHPFTMEQVIWAQIPIRIKNVENPSGPGTVIFPDNISRPGEMTPPHPPKNLDPLSYLRPKQPTAVTTKSDIIVLNVHSNKRDISHGFLARIFTILDKWRLVVDLISTSEVHVSMALHASSPEPLLKDALVELRRYGTVDVTYKLCIVSLVGKQMKQLVGIAGQMFSTLARAGINIEMISQGASEINISCVIDEKDALKALNVLHQGLMGPAV